jgi:hypothetical protein
MVNHWVFEDAMVFKIWMYILFMANYEDKKIMFAGTLTTIKRGQYMTSVRKIARAVHSSEKKVRHTLEALKMDNMVVLEGRARGTLITIVNYGVYQDLGHTKRQSSSALASAQTSALASDNITMINNDLNKENKRAAPSSPSETVTIPRVYED